MTAIRRIKTSFSAGELSAELIGRADLRAYENGAARLSNVFILPTGTVKLNGSDSDSIGSQLICYNFALNGSGSAFMLDYVPDDLFHLKGVGLVE